MVMMDTHPLPGESVLCLGAIVCCLWGLGHVTGAPAPTFLMLKAEPLERQLHFVCPWSAFLDKKYVGQNQLTKRLEIFKQSPCANATGKIILAVMSTSEAKARVSGDLRQQLVDCADWVDKDSPEASGNWENGTVTLTLGVNAGRHVNPVGIYGCSFSYYANAHDVSPKVTTSFVNVTGDKEYYNSDLPGFNIRFTQKIRYCLNYSRKRGCCFEDSEVKRSTSDEIDALIDESTGYGFDVTETVKGVVADLGDDEVSNTGTDICPGTLHFANSTSGTKHKKAHPPESAYLHLNTAAVYECHQYETNTWICNRLKHREHPMVNSLHPGIIAAIVVSLAILAGLVTVVWVVRNRKWLREKCVCGCMQSSAACTSENEPNEDKCTLLGQPNNGAVTNSGDRTQNEANKPADTETTGSHAEEKMLNENDRKSDSKPEDDENTDNTSCNNSNESAQAAHVNIKMRGRTAMSDDNNDHSVRQHQLSIQLQCPRESTV